MNEVCLRSYLRSFRGVSEAGATQTPNSLRPPTPKDIVGFAYQIALGMEYLERGVAGRQVSSTHIIQSNYQVTYRLIRQNKEGNVRECQDNPMLAVFG